MHLQAVFAGCRFDVFDLFQQPDLAAAAVMGVLDADQPGAREMGVHWAQRLLNVRAGENAALAVEAAAHHPGQGGRAAGFVIVDVRIGIDQHLVARFGVPAHGQLVGHGAGSGVKGGRLAEEGRSLGLQCLHRRVIAKHIVADFRLGHGLAHGRGGFGHCVATQINHRRRSVAHAQTRYVIASWTTSAENDSIRPKGWL